MKQSKYKVHYERGEFYPYQVRTTDTDTVINVFQFEDEALLLIEEMVKFDDRMETQFVSDVRSQVGGDHYSKMTIQPIEFINANGLSYMQGNVIKYVCRYRDKNGIEDLEKAKHYIDMMIAELTHERLHD